jgi:cytochrome P450
MALAYRPDDPAVLADPFPLYRRMQDEDPAHWSPHLRAWVLTRYDDVKAACLDLTLSSDRLTPFFAASPEATRMAALQACLTRWMVFRDPPDHTRLRRLAAKVFNVRSINALRPGIEATTQWLLDRIGERERFDFVAEFASPLPVLVIMDMLGVPRDEMARL